MAQTVWKANWPAALAPDSFDQVYCARRNTHSLSHRVTDGMSCRVITPLAGSSTLSQRAPTIQRWPSLYVVLTNPPTRVVPTPPYCLRRASSSPRTVHSRYRARAGGRHVRRNSRPPTLVRRLESGSVPYNPVPPICMYVDGDSCQKLSRW